MAKYDISHRALEDLYRIWECTVETWSEDQADKYYRELIAGINDIVSAPLSKGQPFFEILPNLRGYHIRKHVIFYTIQQDGRILVVRILHERMDYSIHF